MKLTFKKIKKILGLTAGLGVIIYVLSFILIVLVFHYTSHSYFSTDKIWAYTKGDRIMGFHLYRAEFFRFPKPLKEIKQEKHSFRVLFPDTVMYFDYYIRNYAHGDYIKHTRPIIERYRDETLFHVLIEGDNGDRWEYTSPTIYELLTKSTFGLKRWVIDLGQRPLIYSPRPGYYTVTLTPNVGFIKEILPYENISFFNRTSDKSPNPFVQRLIRINAVNKAIPLIWLFFLLAIGLIAGLYFLGKNLIKEIKS